MCEAGRVLHHLRNTVEDPRNAIVVVGFMAKQTLGRRIVERQPRLRILGVERDLRAEVHVLNGFSAHADRDALLAYARSCEPSLRRMFLNHGEPEQQEPLARTLRERGMQNHVPDRGDGYDLD